MTRSAHRKGRAARTTPVKIRHRPRRRRRCRADVAGSATGPSEISMQALAPPAQRKPLGDARRRPVQRSIKVAHDAAAASAGLAGTSRLARCSAARPRMPSVPLTYTASPTPPLRSKAVAVGTKPCTVNGDAQRPCVVAADQGELEFAGQRREAFGEVANPLRVGVRQVRASVAQAGVAPIAARSDKIDRQRFPADIECRVSGEVHARDKRIRADCENLSRGHRRAAPHHRRCRGARPGASARHSGRGCGRSGRIRARSLPAGCANAARRLNSSAGARMRRSGSRPAGRSSPSATPLAALSSTPLTWCGRARRQRW